MLALFKSSRLRSSALSSSIHAAMQWTSAPNIAGAPLPQRARSYWKAWTSALGERLERLLEAERAQLPPWFVVGFGTGIAAWFALGRPRRLGRVPVSRRRAWRWRLCARRTDEADGRSAGSRCAAALGCALVWVRARVGRGAAARSAGGRVASTRRIERVEPMVAQGHGSADPGAERPGASAAGPGFGRSRTKRRRGWRRGATVRLRARLMPPPPMALPGTYDFARDAWFQRDRRGRARRLGPVERGRAGPERRARCRAAPARAAYSRAAARQRGRDRHRLRDRRPECGQPGGCRRDAAQRAHASAVGQRAAHRRRGRRGDAPEPQAAGAERAAGAALQPGAGVRRRSPPLRASATRC